MDNARELSMGGMRQTCEEEGIKLHRFVRYNSEWNGVVERTIGLLTNAVPCHTIPAFFKPYGQRGTMQRHMYTTGRRHER